MCQDLCRGAAQPERDRPRRVWIAGRDDVADLEASLLGERLEASGEEGREAAGLGGADAGGDEEVDLGHSFTVAIGLSGATRVASWWASSAAMIGSIAL